MLLTGSTAIISFIGLFIVEQKSKDPIINFHYFINRQFICSTLANGAVVAVAVVSFFLLPLYLQTIRNEAVLIVGLMLLPITAAMTISSALIEKMVTKIGDKNSIIIGLISLLVAFIMQAIFKANSSITFILIAFILFGIGWGTIWGQQLIQLMRFSRKRFRYSFWFVMDITKHYGCCWLSIIH